MRVPALQTIVVKPELIRIVRRENSRKWQVHYKSASNSVKPLIRPDGPLSKINFIFSPSYGLTLKDCRKLVNTACLKRQGCLRPLKIDHLG